MPLFLAALILVVLSANPLFGAELGTPILSQSMLTPRLLDPDLLLTTGGIKFEATEDLTLEPEWGVGYRVVGRDLPGAIEEASHQVHARAGWRLSLADTLSLSAAAKVPVLTYESTGLSTGQELRTRYGYDFARPFHNPLTWTGEFALRLSPSTDLSLYYDQSPVAGILSGELRKEERIGTRLILRFW